MTQAGFSGNDRYLVLGAALIEIAGGVGWGWAALELAAWLARRAGAAPGRLAFGIGTWAVAGALGAASCFFPSGTEASSTSARSTRRSSTRRSCARPHRAVANLGGPAACCAAEPS